MPKLIKKSVQRKGTIFLNNVIFKKLSVNDLNLRLISSNLFTDEKIELHSMLKKSKQQKLYLEFIESHILRHTL